MSFKHLTLAFSFILIGFTGLSQFSFAYASADVLVSEHPSFTASRLKLEKYQQELTKKLQVQQLYYSEKRDAFEEKQKSGATEEELKPLLDELRKLEEEFNKALEESDKKLTEKEKELTAPITEDINNAVASTNKNLDLTALLQPTNNEEVSFVLYASGNRDVTDYVKSVMLNSAVDKPTFETKPADVRIGYTNLEMLMLYMPEYQQLEHEMEGLQEKLLKEVSDMEQKTYALYEEYLAKEKSGGLTDAQRREYEETLRKMDNKNKELAKESEEKVQEQRNERLAQILNKVEAALETVASNYGFDLILNQTNSSGVSTIVFGPDDGDITSVIHKELGVSVIGESEVTEPNPKTNLRVGFVNVELILASLPETAEIEKELSDLENTLTQQLKNDQDHMYALYEECKAKNDDPNVSDEEKKKCSDEVNDLSEKLEKDAAKADEELQDKRSELLSALGQKIQDEIDEIAKKEGYDYIINQTSNNVLHVKKKYDLTEEIQAKLK